MKNVISFQDKLGQSYQKGWEYALNNFEQYIQEEGLISKKHRRRKD